MRLVYLFIVFLIIMGCSSGTSNPVNTPGENSIARIGFSNIYTENDNQYVDISVKDIPKLYQFSLRMEYDPDCIEIDGFEPSREFGDNPIVFSEGVRIIQPDIKSDMRLKNGKLFAIAVSRPYPHLGDISNPGRIGRLRLRLKCGSINQSLKILNREDFLVFRDSVKNRIHVTPDERLQERGGDA
jgi:hypothetical protein